MATLSSIVRALESLAKRTRFHEKIMLGMVAIARASYFERESPFLR